MLCELCFKPAAIWYKMGIKIPQNFRGKEENIMRADIL